MDTTTVEPLSQLCKDYLFDESKFTRDVHWFLIPAVAIMLLLCLMEKRKSFKPNLMGGRPGIVRPFAALDETSNRWGIMFVFGSVTGIIIQLTQKAFFKELNGPIWTKIFIVYLYCLEISVVCYPLFACMTTRHKLFGAVVGLLYSLGWFAFEIVNTVVVAICIDDRMPPTLCYFIVVVKFCFKLHKCLKKGIYKVSQEEQVKLCKPFHLTYVKTLLNKSSVIPTYDSLTWKQKIQQKLIRRVPGFRFPVSVMISTFMSGVMLYSICLACAGNMETFAKYVYKQCKDCKDVIDLIQAANVIATIITFLCGIRNIYVFHMNYRRDMLMLFKGDKSFIPSSVRTSSPNVYMARGLRFIGTSITGMLWGTLFCYLFVFLPLTIMLIVIKVLIVKGKLDQIWEQFQWLVYPICMITIFKVQTFLIGQFFIQPKINDGDEKRPLAVDNRIAYDVYSFFTIFLNASIGVFAFLKRILMSAFLGVFLIPRMDRSLLMHGYEGMDKFENRRDKKPLRSALDNPVYGNFSSLDHIPLEPGKSLAKKRWWLAFTLIRNPTLVALRVRECKAQQRTTATASMIDIKCDDGTGNVNKENSTDAWEFHIRCCRNYKLKIPSTIVINVMVFIAALAGRIIYAGVAVLIGN